MKGKQDITSVLAALRALQYHQELRSNRAADLQHPKPFITISRQAGAGGRSIALALAARLNKIDPGDLPWTVWDNELVEKVVAKHHLPRETVAALESDAPSWLEQSVASLALGGSRSYPEDGMVYHAVATTIRSLTEMGRVAIVGRGGAFITSDIAGGIHLRLVAPLQYRVLRTAEAMGTSDLASAEATVRQRDHSREQFYQRHWPERPLVPENFTGILNTAAIPTQRLIECFVHLVIEKCNVGCSGCCD